jgi:hypothetical protein
VETRYFGENIKGMAARLGNIEKTYTFNMRNLYNIPKAGQLWDDDYYIASVSVEVNQDLFTVSCGLSKNFNRKSQYIGASSYKRIYEVSEKMVQERHSVYTDYIVFTDVDTEYSFEPDTPYLYIHGSSGVPTVVKNLFESVYGINSGIWSVAIVTGGTKNFTWLNTVMLPVVASAFGNVMEFTWEYKDNYSAGIQAVSSDGGEDVDGTFGQEVQYADYYGRMYYLDWSLCQGYNRFTGFNPIAYPEYNGTIPTQGATTGGKPIVIRKDSREALKMSYQIEFVTDNPKFVVGSACASLNTCVVNASHKAAKLYVLKSRVNKFAETIDLSEDNAIEVTTASGYLPYKDVSEYFMCEGVEAPIDGIAWAYVIPQSEGDPYTVEDEDGNISTITPTVGGEILLAKNEPFKAGDVIGAFKTFAVGDVYQYLKNKTKKEN